MGGLDPRLVRAEQAMRDGFACAGDGDGDAMVEAFRGLSGEESAIAVNLARRVILEALNDAEPDGMTDEDFRALSANVAQTMSWANLDTSTVETYLRELHGGQVPTTDEPDTVALSIVIGGYLMAALAPEDRPWTDYLDKLLDRIVVTE
jgi:hypothetical protein